MKIVKIRKFMTGSLCGIVILLALCGAGGTPEDIPDPQDRLLKQENLTEDARISVNGPFFTEEGNAVHLEKEFVRDGVTYRLVSETLENAVQEGILTYVSSDIAYELEGDQEPPDTAWITLTDERTGKTYERQLPRVEVTEKGSQWVDGFSFEIAVTEYDADVFLIGETEIPADSPLENYEAEFLKELGLPADCYRIDTVRWLGEEYIENGILCRNALAEGQKLVRQTTAKYGGQVRTPELMGKRYLGIYEAEETEKKMEEATPTEMEETGFRTEEDREQKKMPEPIGFRRWIREHLTVITVSIFAAVAAAAAVGLCLIAGREKKN